MRKRPAEHNQGIKTPIQPSKRPAKLMYSEGFKTRIEAAAREKEIKG
ncbi:MAG: hypothetical protein HYV77_03735 [Candidatus Wildermuthbacteria bacterium]|nr:hypothetical protein [Candidatus Wildermuthbacteria bacterium]